MHIALHARALACCAVACWMPCTRLPHRPSRDAIAMQQLELAEVKQINIADNFALMMAVSIKHEDAHYLNTQFHSMQGKLACSCVWIWVARVLDQVWLN